MPKLKQAVVLNVPWQKSRNLHMKMFSPFYARIWTLVTASLSKLIYSTHLFPCSLSFLCLCLLRALRCPGLLVWGATGPYRRSGAHAFPRSRRSLGYRCAQGQSPFRPPYSERKANWENTLWTFTKVEYQPVFRSDLCARKIQLFSLQWKNVDNSL